MATELETWLPAELQDYKFFGILDTGATITQVGLTRGTIIHERKMFRKIIL